MDAIPENIEMHFGGGLHDERADSSGSDPQPEPQVKKKRKQPEDMKKRSEVWKHFTVYFENNKQRAKCNYCGKTYAADPVLNGTSTMNSHMKSCKLNPNNTSQSYTIDSFTQNVDLRDMSSHVSAPSKFDQEACREALAKMCIIDELAFRFVEGEGFRNFLAVACPQFVVPSRITVARDCLKVYFVEKNKFKEYFKKTGVRVSLTTDTWTSNQKLNYMCLTAHFIDDQWKLHKLILNFVPITSHKGEDVGILIEKCLLEWGIDKIFTVTVDNASSNDTTVAYLKKRFVAWKKAICEGKFLHMRCIAHIINLVVRDGLTQSGPAVERVRTVVRYLRQSPARWKKFKEYAVEEKIESKKLLSLDCPTRWNSCYFMLETALIFRTVFDRYEICEKEFRDDFGPNGHYGKIGLPTCDDWAVVERLVKILKHFYDLTVRISATKFVTSNSFLDDISDIDALIKLWISGTDIALAKVAEKMKEKFDKYWGDPAKMNMMLFVVVILDPRHKMKFVNFTLKKLYNEDLASIMSGRISTALEELFEEYKKLYGPTRPTLDSLSSQSCVFDPEGSSTTTTSDERLELRQKRHEEYRIQCILEEGDCESQSELDTYLSDKKEKNLADFDILVWWRMNAFRYPILAKLASDLLAMPISTVASESTFSTSGRVIDDFRSSLTPRMSQALICAQDWLRNGPPKLPIEEEYHVLEKIEEDAMSSVDCSESVVMGL